MKIKEVLLSISLVLITCINSYSQVKVYKVKIIDNQNVTTIINDVRTGGLQIIYNVYRGESSLAIDFKLISKITILTDKPIHYENYYLRVLINYKSGESDIFEMSKSTDFSGQSTFGNVLIRLSDLKTIEFIE